MLKINDASNFRRTVAGLCLIAAPVVAGLALLVHPGEGDAGLVGSIAANPGRVEVASLLIILSTVLFVPALMGVLNLVRGRGVTLVHIGVGLMLIGVIGHAVWTTFQIVMVALVQSDINQSQLAAAVEGEGPIPVGLMVGLVMFMAGFFGGILVLAAGLWRSRVVPRWIPMLLLLSFFTDFMPGGKIGPLLGAAVAVVCLGSIGLKLLGMSDADWEQVHDSSNETVSVGNAEPRVQ
jgi:hypothetical protein